jgi:hypothetical protein
LQADRAKLRYAYCTQLIEKNWRSGYQEEVKNVQFLTDNDGRKRIAIGHLSFIQVT